MILTTSQTKYVGFQMHNIAEHQWDTYGVKLKIKGPEDYNNSTLYMS